MDYPKMLYNAEGAATTVNSAEGEAEIRKQGYMSLAELSTLKGAHTAPSADQEEMGVSGSALPAGSVYDPNYKAPVPPKVTSMLPHEGIDGESIAISGSGFQPRGEHSQVKIGTYNATIVAWEDDFVTVIAVQSNTPFDSPQSVYLRPDGKQDVRAGTFTFVAAKDAAKHDPRYDTKRK